jgi:hypothetical protein
MFRWIRRSPVIVTASLLTVLLTAAPVAATNSLAFIGEAEGPTFFAQNGLYQNIAQFSMNPGKWWMTATATVDASADAVAGNGETSCQLKASAASDTTLDEATWAFTGGVQGRSVASLFLTGVFTSANAWTISLDCLSDSAQTIQIEHVRVSGIKGVTGSGSPKIASQAIDGPVNFAAGTAFHTVGSLSLGAGKWWIVAKTNLMDTSTSNTSNVTCRIVIGTDTDQTTQGMYYTPQQGREGEVAVQVGHVFGSAGTASLQCGKGKGTSTADHIRLVAIKAGKLTRVQLGGSPSSSGTGTPAVITGYRSAAVTVAVSSSFASMGSISLPVGSWFVSAKAWLHDGTDAKVECQLTIGGSSANDLFSYGAPAGHGTGLYLQTGSNVSTAATADLKCKADGSGTTLSYVRITALSASHVDFATLLP